MAVKSEFTNSQLSKIKEGFGLNGALILSQIESGHIHNSYKWSGHDQSYLLQQLNTKVFPNTQTIFDNVVQLQDLLEKALKENYPFKWFRAKDHKPYFDLEDGTRWRLLKYIENSFSYQACKSDAMAAEAGRVLGLTHRHTCSIDPDKLKDIIPGFHDMGLRIDQLENAIQANPKNRLQKCEELLEFINQEKKQWLDLHDQIEIGTIPLHATHNDPKLENILFDKDDQAICLIDMDTVMAGSYLYDVGDLLRSCCTSYLEDDPIQHQDAFNLSYFQSVISNYAKETKVILLESEWRSLASSGLYMTFIMGIRFVTDYINGDTYYHIGYADQNYNRCMNQLNLYKKMKDNLPKLIDYVADQYKS